MLKYALQFSDASSIAWFRLFFASLMLGGFLAGVRPQVFKGFKKGLPLLAVVAGFLLGANYLGYLKGIEYTTASNTQIMIQTGPIMLLFAGVFYFKERLTWIQWAGITSAIIGLILFYWDQAAASLLNIDQYLKGNIWIFMAAATWALYAIFNKKLILKSWNPQLLNIVIFFSASLVLIPTTQFSHFSDLSLPQLSFLLLLSFNTILAYGCLSEAIKLIPASQVSLIITVNPLITLLLFQLMSLLDMSIVEPEPLAWRGYLGALLVVSGVAIAVSFKRAAGQRS